MKTQDFIEIQKLPVTNYDQLSDLQQSLLESIIIISQSSQDVEHGKNLKNCIYWLAKIVLASYPRDLLETS